MLTGGLALWILFAVLVAFFWLWSRSNTLRRQTGLPEGDVIYTDTGAWFANDKVLHSSELRLVGKPDYLVEQTDGVLVPVEIKSGVAPAVPHEAHVLQLAAYCLLVHEHYGTRPGYGILQYQDIAFAVDYTVDLEEDLLALMDEMRDAAIALDVDRDHRSSARCAGCGVRNSCDRRLA